MYRLTDVDAVGGGNIESYAYDAVGNRTSKTVGAASAASYVYGTSSHRLQWVDGTRRGYDLNGNTTLRTLRFLPAPYLSYDERNRLSAQVGPGGDIDPSFSYNARGERVLKNVDGLSKASRTFAYDESGRLLAELDQNSAAIQEYIWLDDLPVGLLNGGTLHHLQPDHLGSPRKVIQTSNNTALWNWPILNNPFGETAPTGSITLNLRFPGQYFDAETGLHYNYFRDYEPGTGRYVESDPIGLRGGSNTFGYALQNPGRTFDEYGGQASTAFGQAIGAGGAATAGAAGSGRNGNGAASNQDFVCMLSPNRCNQPSPATDITAIGGAFAAAAGLLFDWCNKTNKEKCYDDCYVAYEAQAMLCRAIKTARQRETCWANAAVLLGQCQRRCK